MGRVRNSSGDILGGHIDERGYHCISLFNLESGHTGQYFVHKLVLIAFTGNPPMDMPCPTVQHKNRNKLDNRLDNLMWMSAEDNNRDGHATKIHILDSDEYFDSRVLASLSIQRWGGYIAECMHLSKPVLDSRNNIIHFEYQSLNTTEWIEYIPSKPVYSNVPKRCYVTDDSGKHQFESMCHADRYLGQYEGYTRYRCAHNKPVYNSEGEQVLVELI